MNIDEVTCTIVTGRQNTPLLTLLQLRLPVDSLRWTFVFEIETFVGKVLFQVRISCICVICGQNYK